MVTCLNCGAEVAGRHCPACGQAASVARLDMRQALAHAAGHLLNLDAVVPRTVLALMRNPGQVCREYVEGRRTTYVQPFRYCLSAVALLMLVHVLLGAEASGDPFRTGAMLSPALLQFQTETLAFVRRHLNVVIFAALPLLALVLKGLFSRSRYNYAETMSFVLFVMGHSFLLGAVITAACFSMPGLQFGLRLVVQAAYLAWAAVGFYGGNRLAVTLKSALATVLYTVVVAVIVLVLVSPRLLGVIRELKTEKARSATVHTAPQASDTIAGFETQLKRLCR